MFKVKGLTICLAILFVFLLSACGSDQAGTGSVADTNESAQNNVNEGSEEVEARIYESEKGPIELPQQPERVVVVDQDYVGDVLATGLTPIATTGWVFETPYYKEQLRRVESVGDKSSFSIEKITSLDPDLILTYQEEQYENLSKIASTVWIPYGKHDYTERLLEIGKILNRETEAKQWLADFSKKVEVKKEELADIINGDPKIAILEITDKELYLFGDSYGRGGQVIYNDLNLKAPQKVAEVAFEQGWASISQEVLSEYLGEADYILLGVREAGLENQKEIMKSRIWQDLPAVKAGNIMEYEVNTFYFQDPIALEYQLNEIAAFLQSKNN